MARPVDESRAAERREAITIAAARLFAEHGYDGTTASAIARAAGVSSGSVFYYFTDKRAVFRSIFERDLPQAYRLSVDCEADPDPISGLLRMIDGLAESATDPTAPGLVVELFRQIAADAELIAIIDETTEVVRAALARLVGRAIADGIADPGLDPGTTAEWFQSIIDGAFLNAAPGRDPRPLLRTTVLRYLIPSPQGHRS